MTPTILTERLTKVRQAIVMKTAALREAEAQINALLGRAAELTELLALPVPTDRQVDHGEA